VRLFKSCHRVARLQPGGAGRDGWRLALCPATG